MNYIYGELCESVEKVDYTGKSTNTATVSIDNDNRTIAVDVKFAPEILGALPTEDGNYLLRLVVQNGTATLGWTPDTRNISMLAICGENTVCRDTLLCNDFN